MSLDRSVVWHCFPSWLNWHGVSSALFSHLTRVVQSGLVHLPYGITLIHMVNDWMIKVFSEWLKCLVGFEVI